MKPEDRIEALERALRGALAAMREAREAGCVDHLDASRDAGRWWWDALEAGEAALARDGAP